ncbi:MAG: EAL domain-containing protein, partial [Pseudomonadota bacterium]
VRVGVRALLLGVFAGVVALYLVQGALFDAMERHADARVQVAQAAGLTELATTLAAARSSESGPIRSGIESELETALATLEGFGVWAAREMASPDVSNAFPAYAAALRGEQLVGPTTRFNSAIAALASDLRADRAALSDRIWLVQASAFALSVLLTGLAALMVHRAHHAPRGAHTATQPEVDRFTGLPTAEALALRLDPDMPSLTEHRPTSVAVMLKFVPVGRAIVTLDDTVFRELMREIGKRLSASVGDTAALAFCGQGIFCFVQKRAEPDSADKLIAKISDQFADAVPVGSARFALRLRYGLAHVEADDTTARVLARARKALDHAFEADAEAPVTYTPEIGFASEERETLARDLVAALERGEIEGYFQPQVHLGTGRVQGFETLARWHHPTRGMVSPGVFLPIAETHGLEDMLGRIVTAQAIRALRSWDDAGFGVAQVGVNFSASQLSNPKLVDLMKWSLDEGDIAPQRFAVEVLESITVDGDNDPVLGSLKRLSALGCRIDLDDFGTGFASISGLRRFNADRIKIDRSFVTDLHYNTDNQKMVTVMVNLAKGLRLDVLAEGVETKEEATMLRRLGCNLVQGYFIAKPMPLDATHSWLAEHTRKWQERREAGRSVAV